MTDANVWRQLPPSIHERSINTTTIAGYSIPSQTAKFSNMSVEEAIGRANSNAAFLSEMISFSNPEIEDLSNNDVVQELYRDCVNLHDFINEQLWSVTDPQQIAALLSANEEVTSALTQYRKSVEHEELVAVAREFERLKLQNVADGVVLRPARGREDEELESDNLEEDRLANKLRPLTDFKVNAPAKILRRKPKPNASRSTDAEDAGDSGHHDRAVERWEAESAKSEQPHPVPDATKWTTVGTSNSNPPATATEEAQKKEEVEEDWEIVKSEEVKEYGSQ